MKKTLILYYSLGGNTRKIAKMLHHYLGGDISEYIQKRHMKGATMRL